jgi:hypothetical protein
MSKLTQEQQNDILAKANSQHESLYQKGLNLAEEIYFPFLEGMTNDREVSDSYTDG